MKQEMVLLVIRAVLAIPIVATVDTINYSFFIETYILFLFLLIFLSAVLMEGDEHSKQQWILFNIYFLKVKPALRYKLFCL